MSKGLLVLHTIKDTIGFFLKKIVESPDAYFCLRFVKRMHQLSQRRIPWLKNEAKEL